MSAAIALGILINLIVAPRVGINAAGLVVPGYLALHLTSPSRILATFVVAVATWALVKHGLSHVIVLYGRRRLGITVLVGFALTMAFELLWQPSPLESMDLRVIGHIVPGLIANEAVGQGMVPTAAMTIAVAALVRVLLLVLYVWLP